MDVLHFLGFRPILNDPDFGLVHLQSFFGKDEAKVFDGVGGEVTFVQTCIKTMLSEMTEDLTDMLGMFGGVVGVDKDVV